MLPEVNRLRSSAEFSAVVRSGARVRCGTVVVHQHRAPQGGEPVPLIGLIVSKAVGGSVVRHRVSRRLRAQLAARLPELVAATTVVRALPGAATSTSTVLGADLDRAIARLAARR